MTEKEIKDRAEEIIESLTALSLGKEPNILSSDVFKKLAEHKNFEQIKSLYISRLNSFNAKVISTSDIKALFDFRIQIVELYDSL